MFLVRSLMGPAPFIGVVTWESELVAPPILKLSGVGTITF